MTVTIPTSQDVDIRSPWDTLVSAVESATGSETFFTVLGVIGVLVIIAAAARWIVAKRRGGGGGGAGLFWALLLGVALAAPRVIGPICLWCFDLVATAVVRGLQSMGVG